MLSLAVLPVAPMVSVEAPDRILISGQSISCVVPVTDCWDVAVEREKKPENLSVKEGELDAGGGAEVGRDPARHAADANFFEALARLLRALFADRIQLAIKRTIAPVLGKRRMTTHRTVDRLDDFEHADGRGRFG